MTKEKKNQNWINVLMRRETNMTGIYIYLQLVKIGKKNNER